MNITNQRDLEQLQQRYKGLPDGAVVGYVDESYRLGRDCCEGETPFYVMAAVLLRVEDHTVIREDLIGIAGEQWWHTTDRQRTPEGRQRIEAMTDYLSGYHDPCVIAVRHTPGPDETGRTMRATCLTALLETITRPDNPAGTPATAMVVLEKQREQQDTNRDRYTISQAVKAGRISRNLPIHFVSPTVENLLWLPDLVTNTYRRYLTHHDTLVKALNSQTVIIDLDGETSDPLAAAAYVQGVSPLFRKEE